jgi:hypothetical protein
MKPRDVVEQRKAARIAIGAKPGSQVHGCKGTPICTVKRELEFIETGRDCVRCDVHVLQANGRWIIHECSDEM